MIYLGIFLILVLGFLIVNFINPKITLVEKVFSGFLISSGLISFLWFIVYLTGVTFNLSNTLSVLSIALVVFVILNVLFKRKIYLDISTLFKFKKYELIIGTLILLAFASSFLADIYWPIRDWDALTLYDFRGRFFASQNDISSVFDIHRYYLGYPLYTSIFHGFIYLIDDTGNPLFIYALIYISLIAVVHSVLSRITNKTVAMVFTFVIAFTYEIFDHSLLAYTNLPYSSFLIIGYLYLLQYFTENSKAHLFMSALFIGLSGWIRSSDPFWIPPILLLIYEAVKSRKYNSFVVFVLMILFFRVPWSIYVSEISKNYAITSSNNIGMLFSTSLTKYIDQLFLVIPYVWVNVIKPQLSVYILFALSLLVYLPKQSKTVNAIKSLVLINLAVIFGGVYFYSIVYDKWQVIGNSVTRMSIFMTPLILIQLAIILYNWQKSKHLHGK